MVRSGSGCLRDEGAQAQFAHERWEADALSVGLALQHFEVFFGKAHQDFACQLALFAVAHLILRTSAVSSALIVVSLV
ncbi:hypothetical protein A5624_10555 [Mycobacterium sp. 1482292.6]|nr:hypothetical protein A5624_10555 [Mycobacterium sp. 1482292.6]OBJ24484.1 hypothetical protein A5622_11785 [Mycobacterium sp. 1245801.1]